MYNGLSSHTARAREEHILRLDCFRDDYSIIDIRDECTRSYVSIEKYVSPEQTIDTYLNKLQKLPEDYKGLSRWYNQPHYVEIWIEKNATVPEFKSIRDEVGLEVRLVPHGGYVSLSQLNDSVERLFKFVMIGKKHIHILYFGDFDPSGVQMFEDIKNRLATVWGLESGHEHTWEWKGKEYKFSFDLQRIAVNKDQVIEYNLPKDPQSEKEKEKLDNDTRTKGFVEIHGRVYASELDALPVYIPDIFRDMIVKGVNQYFDQDIYNRELEAHKEEHSPDTITKLVKQNTKQFLKDFDQEDIG